MKISKIKGFVLRAITNLKRLLQIIIKKEKSKIEMTVANDSKSLIVERTDGTFLKIKSVIVNVDYVNADGTPAQTPEGKLDTGNYTLLLNEEDLGNFPQELIQSLAQIYDAKV